MKQLSPIEFSVRDARPSDVDAIIALMPRLADFDLPQWRNKEHLWKDDAELIQRWQLGEEDGLLNVAVDSDQKLLGFSLVRLRPELLSHSPSAHLEAIAIEKRAEGTGVAHALLKAAEESANAAGALTMTLHVFAKNARARAFYDRAGYDGELLRYIKHLE